MPPSKPIKGNTRYSRDRRLELPGTSERPIIRKIWQEIAPLYHKAMIEPVYEENHIYKEKECPKGRTLVGESLEVGRNS